MKAHGVYVLSNPSYRSGLVKIGFTTNHISERLRSLNSETGVPTPFKCEMFIACDNPRTIEKKLHHHFRSQKENKEYYNVHPYDVQTQALKLLDGSDYSIGIRAESDAERDEKERQAYIARIEAETRRKQAEADRKKKELEEARKRLDETCERRVILAHVYRRLWPDGAPKDGLGWFYQRRSKKNEERLKEALWYYPVFRNVPADETWGIYKARVLVGEIESQFIKPLSSDEWDKVYKRR